MRWSTFLRLHAQGIVACDSFIAVTATFQLFYVFVLIDHRNRQLIHCNVTAHPSARWTGQQLREAVVYENQYEYLIHDRDSIFSCDLDKSVRHIGLRVLKTPPRSPKANAICERVIGTIRRKCLDWLIPISEAHLRLVMQSWIGHYNRGVFTQTCHLVRFPVDKYCIGRVSSAVSMLGENQLEVPHARLSIRLHRSP
jgi:putative transposase